LPFERHLSAEAKTLSYLCTYIILLHPAAVFTQLTALCPKLCLLKDKGISNLAVFREKEENVINIWNG